MIRYTIGKLICRLLKQHDMKLIRKLDIRVCQRCGYRVPVKKRKKKAIAFETKPLPAFHAPSTNSYIDISGCAK